MKIIANRQVNSIRLNKLPDGDYALLIALGFTQIKHLNGQFAALDRTGKDVILYDDLSGAFNRVTNGAMNDGGQTVIDALEYSEDWESLLHQHPELQVSDSMYSIEEVLGLK